MFALHRHLAPALALIAAIFMAAGCATPRPGVQSGYADVEGGRLYYQATGEGETVILSHGGFGDRRMWDAQIAALAPDFRVIRYDHRGFGRSDPPKSAYSPIADLVALMDQLGVERAHVVGNSMGASLALDFALAHPDRVNRLVVTANGANGYPFEADDFNYSASVFRAAAQDGAERAAALWLAHPMVALTRENPATAPLLAAMITENSAIFRMRHWPRDALAPPAYERLSEIAAPTLFIVGEEDSPAIRRAARASADRLPGAVFLELSGADHMPQMSQPEAFNRALASFLHAEAPPRPN